VQPQTLRIIDANCNRISEGLRLLEDIARFLLNDVDLSQQLKLLRHATIASLNKFGYNLLSARNAEGDVGAGIELSQRQDLLSLIISNAKRAEEGLRVIEEIAKLPEISPNLSSKNFEKARFQLYTLERDLASKVLRRQKIARLKDLYVIIDTQTLDFKDEVDATSKAIHGGARIIQLSDKHYDHRKLLILAQKMKALCQKNNALFIVNDYLDIALAADADGLHIGQEDLPLPVVRKELPIDKIIGCSVHTIAQALKAQAEGADYIGTGSIFPTATKDSVTTIDIEQLKQIKQAVSIPLVAIGGINQDNMARVIAAGADAAAVISAVLKQDNIEQATRQLIKEIEQEANR
jgi:thiamine-phosphate pyrophosphorylase